MGFFSDLKEDLSQAVNELLPDAEKEEKGEEVAEATEEAETKEMDASLEEMLDAIDSAETEDAVAEDVAEKAEADGLDIDLEGMLAQMFAEKDAEQQEKFAEVSEETQTEAEEEDAVVEPAVQEPETENMKTQKEDNKGAEKKMETNTTRVATDETAVITEGMVITGDLNTTGSVDVIGTVNGNIEALGKLNITGHINGNSQAAEIYAESAKICGEVVSEGAVKVGASSVIIGNITATSAAIAGAVKGDIDVKGPVILDASAIVMGNIKSKSVQINNGAVIEGMCSQCYADVSPTSFFDDYKG